eukprot:XP_001700624.1 predicted protein [Chlamydomonas reinhardtii]
MDLDLDELDKQKKAQQSRAFKPALKPVARPRPGQQQRQQGQQQGPNPAACQQVCAVGRTTTAKRRRQQARELPVVDPSEVMDVDTWSLRKIIARTQEETRLVNSTTYGTRRLAPAKWADGDCALFFAALACFGTDFSLIAMLFPEMQRAHIKRKYLKELKENPAKERRRQEAEEEEVRSKSQAVSSAQTRSTQSCSTSVSCASERVRMGGVEFGF